jgi:hypothetical protein
MQKGKRGDVDGVEDGSSAGSKRLAVAREESATAKHNTNPEKVAITRTKLQQRQRHF